ncbi:hypothetical protein GCM10010520_61650 [Rhizobium viscosum]|uniref:DUF4267 domain-containing protein n=1 Tax=Rhizobium viscosum TaxID=1673 RepID=A0ABR9IU66_RHIVS|nr:hypothetical protein [Rhizobium viscosum]
MLLLAFLMWGAEREIGLLLLIAAMIPVGDMLVILAAKGSTKSAFGIHGLTAAVMALAAIPMMTGVH